MEATGVEAMRAKMTVTQVTRHETHDLVTFEPRYSDTPEDNSFAQATPSGKIELQIDNTQLLGKLNPGEQFYVDFTKIKPAT